MTTTALDAMTEAQLTKFIMTYLHAPKALAQKLTDRKHCAQKFTALLVDYASTRRNSLTHARWGNKEVVKLLDLEAHRLRLELPAHLR